MNCGLCINSFSIRGDISLPIYRHLYFFGRITYSSKRLRLLVRKHCNLVGAFLFFPLPFGAYSGHSGLGVESIFLRRVKICFCSLWVRCLSSFFKFIIDCLYGENIWPTHKGEEFSERENSQIAQLLADKKVWVLTAKNGATHGLSTLRSVKAKLILSDLVVFSHCEYRFPRPNHFVCHHCQIVLLLCYVLKAVNCLPYSLLYSL